MLYFYSEFSEKMSIESEMKAWNESEMKAWPT